MKIKYSPIVFDSREARNFNMEFRMVKWISVNANFRNLLHFTFSYSLKLFFQKQYVYSPSMFHSDNIFVNCSRQKPEDKVTLHTAH